MVSATEGIGMAKCIVLASGSPRRRELLGKMGLSFRVAPANIDESVRPNESPGELVRRLAVSKAVATGGHYSECLIIGSDTVVSYQGHIFGKPASPDHAREMLSCLSGQHHQVFTAVALWDPGSGQGRVRVDCAEIEFVSFSKEEVEEYLCTDEPWDKAGAYAIQGYARRWAKHITGDVETIIGLPTRLVALLLSHWDKERQR